MKLKTLGDSACGAEIRARLATLEPADIPRWGSMSSPEMVCHLRESFAGAVAGPQWQKPLARPPLPASWLRFLALRVPVPWPHNVETVPELKRGTVASPAAWEQDCAGLEAALQAFLAHPGLLWPHPIFGPMRPWDWRRWGYLHTDHHLRQFGH